MNIGLIGSGGREHALCKKINDSNLVKKYFVFLETPVPLNMQKTSM